MMAAGLQCHVRRGATRLVAGLAQCVHLGVRLTGTGMPALADDLAITHDDAADTRIRMGGVKAFARQLEGARHEEVVALAHRLFDGSRARRSISSRNSLRSWKRRYTEAKRM